MLSKSDKVRQYLLPPTLKNAISNSTYYRTGLGHLVDKISSLSDIRKIPVLYKEILAAQQRDILCMKEFPDHVAYTQGTTGDKLWIPVFQREIDAFRDLVLDQMKLSRPLPLTLSILGFGDGSRLFPGESRVIFAQLNFGIEHIVGLLQKTYSYSGVESKITIVEGNLLSIRKLTKDLLNNGYDLSKFGVRLIASSGWQISGHLWKLIENSWKASIIDRYYVAEVRGDARYCKRCKWYHFDFTVIPEVVHPLTLLPIREGVGALILTGLYPFSQAQPMIRYWVGDLFHIKPAPCGVKEPSYQFKGRAAHTVYWVSHEKIYYLLFPTDVVHILDEFPDVARHHDTEFLKFRAEYSFERQPFQVKLLIELVYNPELYRIRIAELREEIFKYLIGSNVTLRRFIEQGIVNLNIEFLSPGKLDYFFKI